MSNLLTFKKSFIYKRILSPLYNYKRNKTIERKRMNFQHEGKNTLDFFISCMEEEHIVYWLEFGTLLGAYRDKNFIINDFDIDVGIFISDARRVYNLLINRGFRLVREFHVIGENGLEQTYEYHGVTIDVMYFYESDGLLWCNGSAVFPKKRNCAIMVPISEHWFNPFGITSMEFLGKEVSIPDNVQEHLKEIFGPNFMIYDPNFKGDLNKKKYSIEEKVGMGFVKY